MSARIYLASKNATVTVNGTAYSVMDGSLKEDMDGEEVTNIQSGGYFEEVLTIKKMVFSGIKVVYDSNNVPSWGLGSVVTLALSIPGGTSFSGSVNVKSIDRKLITVRGAYTFTFDGNSNGPYTLTF